MEPKNTQLKHTLFYGVALGIIISVYQLLLYIFGSFSNQALGYLESLITIIGIYISIKMYRDQVMGGTINYNKALGVGVLTAVFIGLVLAIFTYILYKLDGGLIDEMIILVEERNIERGMDVDQIEMQTSLLRQFLWPSVLAFGTLVSKGIGGTIYSLIIAAILKKAENPLEKQES
jgi:hypothetical protein